MNFPSKFRFLIVMSSATVFGQSSPMPNKEKWDKIARYFSPPAELKDKLGKYRSPLTFYNGQAVKTPEQWASRRKEIFATWTDMMGEHMNFKQSFIMT